MSRGIVAVGLCCVTWSAAALAADDADACRDLLAHGEYEKCIAAAATALHDAPGSERLYAVKAKAELTLGALDGARQTLATGLERCPASIQLRVLMHRVQLLRGDLRSAGEQLQETERLARKTPWRYTGAEDLVALGEAALIGGGDPHRVLKDFFERARRESPDCREAWLACGQLTLDLHGPEAAVRLYGRALERFRGDADLHFGMARALGPTDSAKAASNLRKTFEANPRHVPALLFEADRLISTEQWIDAGEVLDHILAINPHETDAWAFRAVLAHLQNDAARAAECRTAALGDARANPAVDHLIGLKLSQLYRFREAAECQRKALQIDPNFIPAKIELSQDLLRLGDEAQAWQLAEEARRQAGPHPAVMNLLELRDRIAQFRTLENEHFIVRMDAREADIYGDRVLALLERARATLGEKYGVAPAEKTIVEIFPDETDFAVRSFGMPSPAGYLAVCFGRVITAGSPAARAEPVNWEAVLWHEFCHTITLDVTKHRMPRWLSEGISVYEEQQENPAWGQRMTPQFRAMTLDGELIPLARMGEALAAPKDPLHVQFAYFQASLFVEFIVERYGIEALKSVLRDLGAGVPFDAALERRTDLRGKVEEEFAAFARRRADELAPEADWEPADLGTLLAGDGAALGQWLEQHPNNLMGLYGHARSLIARGDLENAKEPLQRLIALGPAPAGPESPHALLAEVHRQLGETTDERQVLAEIVQAEAAALTPCKRLLELDLAAKEWQAALRTAERMLAINPLLREPYQAMARAREQLGDDEGAAVARRTLAQIESTQRSAPARTAAGERPSIGRQ